MSEHLAGPQGPEAAEAADQSPENPEHVALQPGQHKDIIKALSSNPEFDLANLKGEALSPQKLAELWDRPEVLAVLNDFLALPKGKARESFVHNDPRLGLAVQQTRRILHTNEKGGTAPDGTEVVGSAEISAKDTAENFLADYQLENPEPECTEACEVKILAKLTLLAEKGLDFEAKSGALEKLVEKLIIADQKIAMAEIRAEKAGEQLAAADEREETVDERAAQAEAVEEREEKASNADLEKIAATTAGELERTEDETEDNKDEAAANVDEATENKEDGAENMEEAEKDEGKILEALDSIGGNKATDINQLMAAAKGLPEGDIKSAIMGKLGSIKGKLDSAVQYGKTPAEQQLIQSVIANGPVIASAEGAAVYTPTLNLLLNNPSISQEAKNSLETHFGVVKRHEQSAKTGTEIDDAVDSGWGTDENGDKIPYTKDRPFKPRENMEVFEEGGQRKIKITVGGRSIQAGFEDGWRGEDVGKLANTMAVVYATEKMGMTDAFFQRGLDMQGATDLDLTKSDMDKAALVSKNFLGTFAAFDGEVINDRDIHRLTENLQWLRKDKGDALGGDGGYGANDSEGAMADLEELGIMDGGTINQAKLEKAALFIQGEEVTGGPQYEAVKKHLEGV